MGLYLWRSASRCLDLLDERIADIIKDAARATDSHLGGAASAARAVAWVHISAASGSLVGRTHQLDEALVTPGRRPRVAAVSK